MDAEHLGARPLACLLRKRSSSPGTRWESHVQDHLHQLAPLSPTGSRTRYEASAEESTRGAVRCASDPADHPADIEGSVLASVVLSDRNATLAEFEDYLRTVNNRDGRPYEEKTISNYVGPGKNLEVWMTGRGPDGDFTILDVATLNRYFRDYCLEHGQGGTHTLQRNLTRS
jgi:hypothetical protein